MNKINIDESKYFYPFTTFDDKLDKKNIITRCLIKCYYCMDEDKNKAYECENKFCPLYNILRTYMSRPYKQLTEEQKEKKRNQLIINRNKKKKQ